MQYERCIERWCIFLYDISDKGYNIFLYDISKGETVII